jgi:phytanoyl-CoA hydroxylase
LRSEHISRFQEQGFLSLGRITTDRELAWLRYVCDEIVKRELGYAPDELSRMTVGRNQESLVTIVSPDRIVPELNNTVFFRNTQVILADLLDVEETRLLTGWRIFCKPAHSSETPWHQDAAYRPPPHRSAGVWMSLDLTTIKNSCMYYIGGSHYGGIRPHHLHDDHLVVDEVDPSLAVACPVSAGEALAHHCYTLHYAGPNTTDRPRRALVIVGQATENH